MNIENKLREMELSRKTYKDEPQDPKPILPPFARRIPILELERLGPEKIVTTGSVEGTTYSEEEILGAIYALCGQTADTVIPTKIVYINSENEPIVTMLVDLTEPKTEGSKLTTIQYVAKGNFTDEGEYISSGIPVIYQWDEFPLTFIEKEKIYKPDPTTGEFPKGPIIYKGDLIDFDTEKRLHFTEIAHVENGKWVLVEDDESYQGNDDIMNIENKLREMELAGKIYKDQPEDPKPILPSFVRQIKVPQFEMQGYGPEKQVVQGKINEPRFSEEQVLQTIYELFDQNPDTILPVNIFNLENENGPLACMCLSLTDPLSEGAVDSTITFVAGGSFTDKDGNNTTLENHTIYKLEAYPLTFNEVERYYNLIQGKVTEEDGTAITIAKISDHEFINGKDNTRMIYKPAAEFKDGKWELVEDDES